MPQRPVSYHEAHVRYLLADIALGGSPDYYRQWVAEGDPDTTVAMRRYEAGVTVTNLNRFERKRPAGKNTRVVYKQTDRMANGFDIRLSSDFTFHESRVRLILLNLQRGGTAEALGDADAAPDVKEARQRWDDHVRVTNPDLFERRGDAGGEAVLTYRSTGVTADGWDVHLTSDAVCEEAETRYLMADLALGGSLEFYREVCDNSTEATAMQAVARWDDGYRVVNTGDYERVRFDGNVHIVYAGTRQRIDGSDVRLNADE